MFEKSSLLCVMRFDVYRIPKCNSNKTAISLHPLTATGFGSSKEHNACDEKVITVLITTLHLWLKIPLFFELACTHSSIVVSKPLLHACRPWLNLASAFRTVWVQPNSNITLDLVPALAALNKCTHYECEIRLQRDYQGLGYNLPQRISELLLPNSTCSPLSCP